jgi:hypothetical protein
VTGESPISALVQRVTKQYQLAIASAAALQTVLASFKEQIRRLEEARDFTDTEYTRSRQALEKIADRMYHELASLIGPDTDQLELLGAIMLLRWQLEGADKAESATIATAAQALLSHEAGEPVLSLDGVWTGYRLTAKPYLDWVGEGGDYAWQIMFVHGEDTDDIALDDLYDPNNLAGVYIGEEAVRTVLARVALQEDVSMSVEEIVQAVINAGLPTDLCDVFNRSS